jgi:competence protein ComEA
MIRNTRWERATALALLIVTGLALAGVSLAAEDSPRLVGAININTATAEELQLLPGVGEARAKAVIALRKQRDGFKSVDELTLVKGIGDAMLERMRPFVRTEGKTTAQLK